MYPRRRLLERYTVTATLPYLFLSLLLLTAVLLAQQAARFSEILGAARAPLGIAAEIALGLLPNILIFTFPMAVLTGTATGFSRMGSDSELVAMRAAGVGNVRIIVPVLILGALASVLTLYVGMELAPEAAYDLRQTALRAAVYRLESPVEPRTFTTEIPGKVMYVRDGDPESGQWGRVFIYWQEQGAPLRIVTARTGRIDSSGEQSELVLSDAVVTTLPETNAAGAPIIGENPLKATPQQMTTERSTQLRIRDDRLNRERADLLKRLRGRDLELDEMNWRELLRRTREGTDRTARRASAFALQRRLALCVAPIVFSLLGAAIGLRMRRGGRGLGMLLSLVAMISYYLVALAGEYMARVGIVPLRVGAWLATGVALAAGILLLSVRRRDTHLLRSIWSTKKGHARAAHVTGEGARVEGRVARRSLFSGLLDRVMVRSLIWNFGVAFVALVAVFLIFTVFELLRFIAVSGASSSIVARYLLFLLPFVMVALAPMSVLVAILVTYALIARRSEAIAWWACGQSVYRLALPGLLFAVCIGAGLWTVQEMLMPKANRMQNQLRTQIRVGIAKGVTPKGRQWLASAGTTTLYSYEYDEKSKGLREPSVYEFDIEGVHLRRLIIAQNANWNKNRALELNDAQIFEAGERIIAGGSMRRNQQEQIEGTDPPEMFKPALNTSAEMDAKQLSAYIGTLKRRGEGTNNIAPLRVALERKRAEPFSPLVMALIGIPLALAFGRRSAIAALCAAIAIGLAFWGSTSGFQQLGGYGLLPAQIAVWSPLVIFAATGVYLLFRART